MLCSKQETQGYIFWPFLGGDFLSKWKTGKNLKEDFMKKGREKKGKKKREKSDKNTRQNKKLK